MKILFVTGFEKPGSCAHPILWLLWAITHCINTLHVWNFNMLFLYALCRSLAQSLYWKIGWVWKPDFLKSVHLTPEFTIRHLTCVEVGYVSSSILWSQRKWTNSTLTPQQCSNSTNFSNNHRAAAVIAAIRTFRINTKASLMLWDHKMDDA